MLLTLPLTLARISFPEVEAPSEPVDLARSVRGSGEVSFRWLGAVEGEPLTATVERLRSVVPELEGLGLERIGTYPGGVLVLVAGELRAPILEERFDELVGALNVLLARAHATFRFVPVRTGEDVLYAAMGAEEAVELLHGGALGVTDLEELLDLAAF